MLNCMDKQRQLLWPRKEKMQYLRYIVRNERYEFFRLIIEEKCRIKNLLAGNRIHRIQEPPMILECTFAYIMYSELWFKRRYWFYGSPIFVEIALEEKED